MSGIIMVPLGQQESQVEHLKIIPLGLQESQVEHLKIIPLGLQESQVEHLKIIPLGQQESQVEHSMRMLLAGRGLKCCRFLCHIQWVSQ
ncbi:hypothetical protein Bpfe_004717 [Biomphalaria pfeifferi]|uniref:Uncharacterized protein n=1 Tax=Biomphalaria pfeifferi TaxID=112525 RepID=A0AAD8C469_BIOPF|nr:hypothetical protein Bpfe_004717 [Biomphalaria pfeifferi]